MIDIRKKSLVIIVFCTSLFVIAFSVFYYRNNLGFKEIKKEINSEKYFDGALEERMFNFGINNEGNAENIFYTPKGKHIEIKLIYSTDRLPIDPNRIEVKINGANGQNKLLPISFSKSSVSTFDYTAEYTGESVGSDDIEVVVEKSPIRYTGKINFYDNSFVVESDISAEDVHFQADNLLSTASKSIEPPRFINGFVENYFDGVEMPGGVQYLFTPKSKNKTNNEATLNVYTIIPSINKLYESEFANEYVPAYLSNIKRLESLLKREPGNISGDMVPDFPPVNASRGGIFDVKIINFNGGKGVRFLVPGYFQAFDPAQQPTYVFQGITYDGRHHIVFRYNNLFSSNLEKELKNDPGFKDNEKMKEWILKTFEAVKSQNEEEFIPRVNEVDSFIGSLSISSN